MSQTKYFNPQEILGFQLGITLRDLRSEMDKRQKQFKLSRYEWLIVGVLLNADKGCLNQCDIRKYLGIEDSYLTKVLDKLIDKKIIQKVICEQDRRQRILTTHPDAETLIKSIAKEIIEANEHYLRNFSKTERQQLFEFLSRIRENTSACNES